MHEYYMVHGWKKTADHFGVSGQTMQKVKKMGDLDSSKLITFKACPVLFRKSNGSDGERTGRALYLAAKSLERALMEHRRAGSPPSDIEHYAFFLLKEILK